jgi:CubicO group peptidase (beta-lactamase class C family)
LTGLSVVITTSETTLMQRGFGYKDIEKAEPADENTRFCIGSLTKAFTSTLVGSLLAENEQLYVGF